MKHVKKIAAFLVIAMIVSLFVGYGDKVEAAGTSEFKQYSIISEKCIMLEFSDGKITYANGSKSIPESVTRNPLTVANVATVSNYSIRSSDDSSYSNGVSPTSVNRKSKGNGTSTTSTNTTNYLIVQEHYIYLNLPIALKANKNYVLTINANNLNCNTTTVNISTNGLQRTDVIHVNQEGFIPNDTVKYAYISSWNGDGGAADLSSYAGKTFNLINTTKNNAVVYSGTITKRALSTDEDTLATQNMKSSIYQKSYLVSDVYQCDFSAYNSDGGTDNFVISVPGIGCSYQFKISYKAYDNAFYTTVRGLYHQRTGIALESKYTQWSRPTNYDPKTTSFRVHYGSPTGTTTNMENYWGWYADAGDLDGYPSHMNVARYLMTIYELKPTLFKDNTLNIPESGDGIPDILGEAGWLVNFGKRVRTTTPTGGVTLRVFNGADLADDTKEDGGTPSKAGVANNLVPSWQDTSTWWCYAENVEDTLIYAAAAAQYGYCLKLAGVDTATVNGWCNEAKSAYTWAVNKGGANSGTQFMAAVWLYKATGEQTYLTAITNLWNVSSTTTIINSGLSKTIPVNAQWAAFACANLQGISDKIKNDCREMIRSFADAQYDTSYTKKIKQSNLSNGTTLRESIFESGLQLNGANTTPYVLESILAYELFGTEKYLDTVETTADYMLGGNALNTVWVTGLGENPVQQAFKIDENNKSNSTSQDNFQAGIVPYGCATQYMDDTGFGTNCYSTYLGWNAAIYPAKNYWPMHEGWFNNRYAIQAAEFTLWQNGAPAAAVYGYLSALGNDFGNKASVTPEPFVIPTPPPVSTVAPTATPAPTPTPTTVKKLSVKSLSVKTLTTKITKISGVTTAKATIKLMYNNKKIKSVTASSKGKFTLSKISLKKYKSKVLKLVFTKLGYKSFTKTFSKIKK